MSDDKTTRIAEAVSRHQATMVQATPLFGGACQENVRVDLLIDGAPVRLALRSDAKSTLPGSLNRVTEFAVVEAAVAAGVKTPKARWLTADLLRPKTHAYFLEWLNGEAIGRRVVKSAELAETRKTLAAELAKNLAALHTVTQATVKLPLEVPTVSPAQHAIDGLTTMLKTVDGQYPAIELCLRWLRERLPTNEEVVLVHGDFRTGNFMISPRGLEGILDWEFAHWGSPFEDLSWVSVRDWRFNQLDLPVGGFSKREPFYEAYTKASGRSLDEATLLWWEVCGNLRWAVGSLFQGKRYLSGEDRDLELIAIAKRHTEMEFEAMRLIERGHL